MTDDVYREWVRRLPLVYVTCGGCQREWPISPVHRIMKCQVCGTRNWLRSDNGEEYP